MSTTVRICKVLVLMSEPFPIRDRGINGVQVLPLRRYLRLQRFHREVRLLPCWLLRLLKLLELRSRVYRLFVQELPELLEEAADLVWKIKANAEVIEPALKRINRTGGIVAGALPLLYGMAEGIVVGATYKPDTTERPPARPAMGVRRSRQFEGVGLKAE